MKFARKFLKPGLIGLGGAALLGALALLASYIYIAPTLPSIEALRDIRLQVPMRIYTRDEKLIAEFGEKKRSPIRFYETPDLMIKAVLAAEDDRFFQHPGVDYQGILRAAINLIRTGEKSQGGSTITMQVARNFFLSFEKTYLRKLSEIFLALKMERELTKEQILELYLNKIYLGNRAYGVSAAAYTYYGVEVDELTVPQMAMIAGLPKAPSRYNPIADRERAVVRRNYVLRRMHELGYLDDETYHAGRETEDDADLHGLPVEVDADYFAELVRAAVVARYGEQAAYTGGFKVYTTLDSRHQQAANRALRQALADYDQRHGYRGPERHVEFQRFNEPQDWGRVFDGLQELGGLEPAIVTQVDERTLTALHMDGGTAQIPWEGMDWARRYINDNARGPRPQTAGDIATVGDVIRVQRTAEGWRLSQLPAIDGALVALRPRDGAVIGLVGGFDFKRSKFNRVTQATRQPGSSFKPFIYSAALEKGFTPATLINDAPVVFDDPALESAWRPENYSGKFFGPTRLRVALMKSRNLVSIRILRSIGVDYAIDYISRFGFPPQDLPRNLSLALGSASVTPLQLARGYAVFANGGYRVQPYFIERIIDLNDEVSFQATPDTVCPECLEETAQDEALPQTEDTRPVASQTGMTDPATADTPEREADTPPIEPAERVLTPENAYLMTTMMRDVVQRGTGRGARSLRRSDIAGKTGTTNDQRDAWFAGFNADLVAIAWVGFDQVRSLGNRETGGRAALPMWVAFMREALKGVEVTPLVRPPGLVTVRIDPESGLLANSGQPEAVFETFRTEHVPRQYAGIKPVDDGASAAGDAEIPEQLF